MAQFIPSPLFQILDANGAPYSGAKMYIYETGTTTGLSLYSDEALSTPAANPVVADSKGLFANVFVAETKFKVVITDSDDVTVVSADPVYSSGASDAISAANVSFDGSGIGFAATNVQDAIEEADGLYAATTGADFTGAVSITHAVVGAALSLESTQAGASSGPDIEFYRNSASPAASDVITTLVFYGEDSAGNKEEYASVRVVIDDPTSASEDATVSVKTVVAGTSADRVHVGGGLYTEGVTGGDKGAGTINAGTLYEGGALLSSKDYALKAWVAFDGTGTVSIAASYNVSSITDNGTGDYTVNFSSALATADYAVLATAGDDSTTGSIFTWVRAPYYQAATTAAVRILLSNNGGAAVDRPNVNVAVT